MRNEENHIHDLQKSSSLATKCILCCFSLYSMIIIMCNLEENFRLFSLSFSSFTFLHHIKMTMKILLTMSNQNVLKCFIISYIFDKLKSLFRKSRISLMGISKIFSWLKVTICSFWDHKSYGISSSTIGSSFLVDIHMLCSLLDV